MRWLIQQLVLNFVQSLKFNYNIRSTRGEAAEEAEDETEAAADTEDEDDASLSVLEKVLPLWLITLFGPVREGTGGVEGRGGILRVLRPDNVALSAKRTRLSV